MDEFYQLFGISAEELLHIPREDIVGISSGVKQPATSKTPAFLKDVYSGLITQEIAHTSAIFP